MVQLLRKIVWQFPQKLEIEIPYDAAILLLGVYPKKLKAVSQKGICTPMFITALFTIT